MNVQGHYTDFANEHGKRIPCSQQEEAHDMWCSSNFPRPSQRALNYETTSNEHQAFITLSVKNTQEPQVWLHSLKNKEDINHKSAGMGVQAIFGTDSSSDMQLSPSVSASPGHFQLVALLWLWATVRLGPQHAESVNPINHNPTTFSINHVQTARRD